MTEKAKQGPLTLHQALPDYLTVLEVAERLGVSPTSVRNSINSGKLPACALGRLFLVHIEDLRRFESTTTLTGAQLGKPNRQT